MTEFLSSVHLGGKCACRNSDQRANTLSINSLTPILVSGSSQMVMIKWMFSYPLPIFY